MSADLRLRRLARLAAAAVAIVVGSGCEWFSDFKRQPDIDPWQSPADSVGMRGNPQLSVPTTGSVAPGFLVAYDRGGPVLDQTLAAIRNPVPADARSIENGRRYYQINCAVCHGPAGGALSTQPGGGALGNGPVMRYNAIFPPSLRTEQARGRTDGYIWGVIRNGRGAMMSYNRIEEMDRWDVVNYIRELQKPVVTVDTTPPGAPGETGRKVPGYTVMGPTRPAPYWSRRGTSRADTTTANNPAATDTTARSPEGNP
ncbi:MAG TPA: cytochrome c [Gemmatimonadaceae bacterium]|nr:cytochrome c [Gemmatimonadaceae bacterium]